MFIKFLPFENFANRLFKFIYIKPSIAILIRKLTKAIIIIVHIRQLTTKIFISCFKCSMHILSSSFVEPSVFCDNTEGRGAGPSLCRLGFDL